MNNKDDLIRECDTNYGVTDEEIIECDYSPDGKHSFIDNDNEGIYGQEICRYCDKKRAK